MIYLFAILVYLLLLTGIGIYKARQVKDQDDFAVAGRSLSPWVMVLTMLAVWIGTGSILGNAEEAYRTGMAALVIPLGTFSGMLLLSFIAHKARRIEVTTVPEVIGNRFGQVARFLAVLALVMAYMVIVSYQFNAGGAVLEVILTDDSGHSMLSAHNATIIAAAFIILYTMLAGLNSLAYTDVVTGSIITISLIIAFPILLMKAGGFAGMEKAYAAMAEHDKHMQFWGVYRPVDIVNFLLPPFLLILGDANQYQRIFASKSAKGARSAVITMIFVAFTIEILIIATAWVATSMTPDDTNGRYIMIYMARHYLPMALGVLFMVTVVGIIISTADSFLLVPATTFIKDVYLNYINPKADPRRTVFLSRVMVLCFGVIAWGVSLLFAAQTGFFKKALYAYTIYGAAITPTLIAAMFWKRATRAGAVSSILGGTLVTLFWEEADFIQNRLDGDWASLDAALPAITISVVLLIGVSLVTRDKSAKQETA